MIHILTWLLCNKKALLVKAISSWLVQMLQTWSCGNASSFQPALCLDHTKICLCIFLTPKCKDLFYLFFYICIHLFKKIYINIFFLMTVQTLPQHFPSYSYPKHKKVAGRTLNQQFSKTFFILWVASCLQVFNSYALCTFCMMQLMK